jgi:2-oxoglutarate ferredoxin oxidoreductase subunit beta
MEHGEPLRFGANGAKAVLRGESGGLTVTDEVAPDDPRVVVHDAHAEDPSYAFALSRLSSLDSRYSPMGVFRSVQRPTYDAMMTQQLDLAAAKAPGDAAALDALLRGADTWSVA